MDNEPKAKWYATVWTFIKEHKKVSTIVAVLLVGIALGAYFKTAKAQTKATLDCPGAALVWNQATATLTCPPATGGGPVVPPVTPPGNDPFAGCPANALKLSPAFGSMAIPTTDFGNQILVVKVAPPASWSSTSLKATRWAEFGGDGPVGRQAVFSTVPCDFSAANALKSSMGAALISNGPNQFSFLYRNGPAGASNAKIEPGKVYFINVRNLNSVCGTQTCNMQGTLEQ